MNEWKEETHVVSDQYDNYEEVQKEILSGEIGKTRTKLLTIAFVIFLFDLLVLVMANLLTTKTLLIILVVPGLITGFSFLSNKEPMTAMILATLVILGVWIYTISIVGGQAVISGWLGKAIIIYLLLAGFQNAREAMKIKRELRL